MEKKNEKPHLMATPQKLPQFPGTNREKLSLFQSQINSELAEAVTREMKRTKTKRREVMEWGLQIYLLSSNPKLAAQLGITSGEKPK